MPDQEIEVTVDVANVPAFVRLAKFAEEVAVYAATHRDPELRRLCQQLVDDMDLEVDWDAQIAAE